MTAKFHEAEMIDPRRLVDEDTETPVGHLRAGDQVGCIDVGRDLSVITTEVDLDFYSIIWVDLLNDPATTADVWGKQVPGGSVALNLAEVGWKVMPLPRILARRRVAS